MIYSSEINKICAVCQKSRRQDDECYCEVKRKTVPLNYTCKKFSYDILKRTVKRARRLKTDYKAEDFEL